MTPITEVEVGDPTGPGAEFHAGQTQVRITQPFGPNGSNTQVILLPPDAARALFYKLAYHLGEWTE